MSAGGNGPHAVIKCVMRPMSWEQKRVTPLRWKPIRNAWTLVLITWHLIAVDFDWKLS